MLDCSLALAWALPDETSDRAERLLAQLSPESTLWVPALWWYELANALLTAQRRKRLAEADRLRAMQLYGALPLQTDTLLNLHTAGRLHALGKDYGLSAYDASYLDVAQRRDLELATLDHPLMTAARRAGIRLVRLH